MASIRKRTWTSGGKTQEAWVIDYFDRAGKRRLVTCEKKKDADAKLTEIKNELAQGIHTPASQSRTIGDLGDLWLAQAVADGLEVSTVKQYRTHLEKHIKPLLGARKLADFHQSDMQTFRNDLRSAGCSDAMVKKVGISLYGIAAHAAEHGLHSHNPIGRAQSRRKKKQEKRHKARMSIPSQKEVQALLGSVADRWRPLLLTAVMTGLRASELRGLSWDNLDLANGMLKVEERADAWSTIDSPKSDAGKRELRLSPIVLNTLRQWKLTCPKRDGQLDLVFPNGVGKVYDQSAFLREVYYPLQKAAGVVGADGEGKYTFHALRHFAASIFIEQGMNPKRVQYLMGHANIQVTFNVYGHLFANDDADRKAVAEIEARLLA
jgi:integrase